MESNETSEPLSERMNPDVALLSNVQPARKRSPSEQLVFSTIRIECEYGGTGYVTLATGRGTGTGFFFNFAVNGELSVPAIVTNKHVVSGAVRGTLNFHLRGTDGFPSMQSSERLEFDNFQSRWWFHPDPNVDLCIMPIGPILQQSITNGKPLAIVPLSTELIPTDQEFATYTPLEEILMIGYPNGIWDATNNMPILRRGITATHPGVAYEGRREFMIDAACFPGSSGSPVMLYNVGTYSTPDGNFALGTRIKLLGILYAGPTHTVTGSLQVVTIPTRNDIQSLSRIPNNLGVVIQSSRLRYFEEECRRLIASSSPTSIP